MPPAPPPTNEYLYVKLANASCSPNVFLKHDPANTQDNTTLGPGPLVDTKNAAMYRWNFSGTGDELIITPANHINPWAIFLQSVDGSVRVYRCRSSGLWKLVATQGGYQIVNTSPPGPVSSLGNLCPTHPDVNGQALVADGCNGRVSTTDVESAIAKYGTWELSPIPSAPGGGGMRIGIIIAIVAAVVLVIGIIAMSVYR